MEPRVSDIVRIILIVILIVIAAWVCSAAEQTMKIDSYTHSVIAPPTSAGATYDFDFTGRTVGGISGGSLSDGDKGDITVSGSGTVWTIDSGVVSLSKLATIATDSILGRATTGTGAPEVLTALPWAFTGDVTSIADANALTIANNAVSLAKMADIATDSILGRATAATGDPEVLTALPFAFTGDVTRPADSNAQTIANDAVTLAKIQNAAANSKLLGSGATGAGADYVEITLGTNLSMSGTTLNATGGGATTFLDLTDTPSSYSGQASKLVAVNAGATALEFVTAAGGGNVSNTGTPTDGQIAQWATATTIRGVTPTSPITSTSGSISLNTSSNFNFDTAQSISQNDAINNDMIGIVQLTHNTTGTAAADMGTGVDYWIEDDSGVNVPAAKVGAGWSDPADATYSAYFDFKLANNAGSPASKMRLFPSGGLSVNSTTDPGAGQINANTGFKVANAALNFSHLAGDFALTQTPSTTASKLIGRGSAAGAGDMQEITLGTNLSMSGTTLNVGPTTFTGLTDTPSSYTGEGTKLVRVNSSETGLEFVTATGGGDVFGPASSTDNAIVRFDGTTGKTIQNSAVTIADTTGLIAGARFGNTGLQVEDTDASHLLTLKPGSNLTAAHTLTLTTGDADRNLTLTGDASITGTNTGDQTITLTGDVTGSGTGSFAATIDNDKVTYAKMQNVSATDRLLGRDTAAAGDVEELTVGGGIEFTGSGGIQTSAFTGDVTKTAGGTATTLVGKPTGAIVGTSDTQTLTNKRITKRVVAQASSATWSPNGDTTDVFTITTAQATNVTTINAPSGTPTDGQQLMFRVKCDGTARTLAGWNAAYRFSSDLAAPSTLVANKTLYMGFQYNSTDSVWDNLAQLNNL